MFRSQGRNSLCPKSMFALRLLALSLCSVFLSNTTYICAQSGPNCQSINASVQDNDSIVLRVRELITNTNTVRFPISFQLTSPFGQILAFERNLNANSIIQVSACDYIDETLTFEVRNNIGHCTGEITFKANNQFRLISNLDTTVWCVDPLMRQDPNDFNDLNWYNTTSYPYTLLPTAFLLCDDDKILENRPNTTREARDYYVPLFEECEYSSYDYDISFPCRGNSDTAKIIYREWSAYDKSGNRITAVDTIRLIKLPEITNANLIAPASDTTYCLLDTIIENQYSFDFLIWKQLFGTHSDGSFIYYPVEDIQRSINLVDGDEVAMATLESQQILIRSSLIALNIYDIADLPVENGPDGRPAYYAELERGDRVLTTNGSYETVTSDWFFSPSTNAIWINVAIPNVTNDPDTTICDTWDPFSCIDGVNIILPNKPYDSDGCLVFCINEDQLADSKCLVSVTNTSRVIRDFFCPVIESCTTTVVQQCFATRVDEIPDDCEFQAVSTANITRTVINGRITTRIIRSKVYIDDLGPLLVDSQIGQVWQTSELTCYAEVTLPPVEVKDVCSGVKDVKAKVANQSFVNFEFNAATGLWEQPSEARLFRLACGGPYPVTYEFGDSCHNRRTVVYNTVTVEDRIPATVTTDNNRTISMTGKVRYITSDNLDEGSVDNCEVRMVLARRQDWKTTCDIDLCSPEIRNLRNKTELEAYILDNGYTAVLDDNDVERHYAEEYEWLKYDEDWCEDLENYVVRGWEDDITEYWIEHCMPKEHYNQNKSEITTHFSNIGGGWSSSVPFCCEDVCTTVPVELLVIDKACNYARGWTYVYVEEKFTATKFQDFQEVNLSCEAYQTYYKEAIERAVNGGNSSLTSPEAFEELDSLMGGLIKGWINEEGILVDENDEEVNTSFSYNSTECQYEINRVNRVVEDHNGEPVTVRTFDTSLVIAEVPVEGELGSLGQNCKVTCEQEVWTFLNQCDLGIIQRVWKIYNACSPASSGNILFQYTQNIRIEPTCKLSKFMFHIPADTTICSELIFDLEGNAVTNTDSVDYLLDSSQCQQIGISYTDEILTVVNQPEKRIILRDWRMTDWCTGDDLDIEQKIELYDTCSLDDSLIIFGQVLYRDLMNPVGQVTVEGFSNAGVSKSYITRLDGNFSFTHPRGADIILVPSKNMNPVNGVDILDILAIRDHVIGRNLIEDHYTMIAADVNNDGVINSKDITSIQEVSLMRRQNFFNNQSWVFRDPQTDQSTIRLSNPQSDMTVMFTGIKIGDVDEEGVDLSRSNRRPILLQMTNALLERGDREELIIDIPEELDGYQFAIQYDTTLVEMDFYAENVDSSDWSKIDANEFRFISTDKNKKLKFRVTAKKETLLSDALFLDNIFKAIAVTEEGAVRPFELEFNDSGGSSPFKLHQNIPNPTRDETVIPITSDGVRNVVLTITNSLGAIIYQESTTLISGQNRIKVKLEGVDTPGVLFYTVRSEGHSQTMKMTTLGF